MTGKKSGEIIQGGISSIKHAATTFSKKLDAVKEAISANTTPVKTYSLERDQHLGVSEDDLQDGGDGSGSLSRSRRASDLDLWGRFSESRKSSYNNLVPLGENNSGGGGVAGGINNGQVPPHSLATMTYPENIFAQEERGSGDDGDSNHPAAMLVDPEADVIIELTSGSQCHNCYLLLYDEEIMAGWSAEDSNLNTQCYECKKFTVPNLTVHVRTQTETVERQKVPYLNPLVLRKELENILLQEGHLALCERNFFVDHPIIYWNLVWIMDRIRVTTHLPQLCCSVQAAEKTNEAEPDLPDDPLTRDVAHQKKVAVLAMWDNVELHAEVGPPMYVIWHQSPQQASALVKALVTDPQQAAMTKTVIQQVLSALRCSDMATPIKRLANARNRTGKSGGSGPDRNHSIYRDILFLALTAIGHNNIDMAFFHQEYAAAFEKLTDKERAFYRRRDLPPSVTSVYCRAYFTPLLLP